MKGQNRTSRFSKRASSRRDIIRHGRRATTIKPEVAPVSRVAAISIYVDDLEKALAFYRDGMGFGLQDRPNPYIIELENDGVALMLCQAERGVKQEYPAGAGTVIGVATTDVVAKAAELKRRGVSLIHDEPQGFPGGKFVAVRDPAGNVVELLQFSA